jgi:hypothetical protein
MHAAVEPLLFDRERELAAAVDARQRPVFDQVPVHAEIVPVPARTDIGQTV